MKRASTASAADKVAKAAIATIDAHLAFLAATPAPACYQDAYSADRSLAALREGGVRYVVVHLAAFVERDPDGLQHISRSEAIRPLASDGDIAIYRVEATTP